MEIARTDVGKVVAFFYFDFTDPSKISYESMIRSLVTQLFQHCAQVRGILLDLYSSCQDGRIRPSTTALVSALLEMISRIPECYILLDALDECEEREKVMDFLRKLEPLTSTNLNALVTSRREMDIERSLSSFLPQSRCTNLSADYVDEDIRRYVQHRWTTDSNLKRWEKKADVRAEIEEALFKRANGM
jgi:hypothetical protein